MITCRQLGQLIEDATSESEVTQLRAVDLRKGHKVVKNSYGMGGMKHHRAVKSVWTNKKPGFKDDNIHVTFDDGRIEKLHKHAKVHVRTSSN